MCAQATPDVALGWDASTDPSVTGYVVYYGAATGAYSQRFDVGTNLTASFSHLLVSTTYYFAVAAYNDLTESPTSDEIAYTIPDNLAPSLTPIADQSVNLPRTLVLTNTATVSPGGSTNLTYQLIAGPATMTLNPTNGILSWIPEWSQAGSTTAVTVLVRDDSLPPLTSSQTFNVTVGNFLQLNLGSTVINAGQDGSVAVTISSSGPVTNLSFTLDAPADWVGNVTVQSLLSNVVVTQDPPGAVHSVITAQTTDGQPLPSQPAFLQVNFTAGQSTIATSLQVSDVTASLANGQLVPTALNSASPLTVVGLDSLLQLQVINGQANLTLYGPIGNTYQIQSATSVGVAAGWNNEFSVTLTNLSQTLSSLPVDGSPMKFFRAVRL